MLKNRWGHNVNWYTYVTFERHHRKDWAKRNQPITRHHLGRYISQDYRHPAGTRRELVRRKWRGQLRWFNSRDRLFVRTNIYRHGRGRYWQEFDRRWAYDKRWGTRHHEYT